MALDIFWVCMPHFHLTMLFDKGSLIGTIISPDFRGTELTV